MFKKLLIVGLAVLTAACVPIQPLPPATSAPLQASEPLAASEQLADCPGGYLNMLPGQSSHDPALDSLPGHIDIVGVKSGLEGETLTATFYLKDIPQELTFNREGVESQTLEYMWMVEINIEGDDINAHDQADYALGTVYSTKRVLSDTPPQILPPADALETMVFIRRDNPEGGIDFMRLPKYARLLISNEEKHAYDDRRDSGHHAPIIYQVFGI